MVGFAERRVLPVRCATSRASRSAAGGSTALRRGEAIGEGVEQPIVIDEFAGVHEPMALLARAALILDGAVWTPAVSS
jgi:hypothetical protein